VGNDPDGDNRPLVVITGANRGGKSKFLRPIGGAQLMMQGRMFVPAELFCSRVRNRVFTHFKRQEDVATKSGRVGEELGRMSAVVDGATGSSTVLLNQSFASTGKTEGSDIARQVVRAMLDAGVRLVSVTHLFDPACSFYRQDADRPWRLSTTTRMPRCFSVTRWTTGPTRPRSGRGCADQPAAPFVGIATMRSRPRSQLALRPGCRR
jgi:hypothetical protein